MSVDPGLLIRLAAAVALAAFAGFIAAESCQAQQIREYKDSSTGKVEYFTSPRRPRLEGGSFFSERYLFLSFHAFVPPVNASVPYVLMVDTNTPNWVTVEWGSSLTLTLDQSDVLPLAGTGSGKRRKPNPAGAGNLLQETALYPLSQHQLVRIGRAKTVAFRLAGSSQSITGSWKPELMADAASLAVKGSTLLGAPTPATPDSQASTQAVQCPVRPGLIAGSGVALGLRYLRVTRSTADEFHMPVPTGMAVATVGDLSLAASLGIRVGDVILKIGEHLITEICDIPNVLATTPRGACVPITIWRQNAESVVEAQF